MMISVAIVGILAAIALPNFVRYQIKTKTVEAKTLLGSIRSSQEAFLAEFDNYANIAQQSPPGPPGPDKRLWPTNDPCPGTCGRTNAPSCDSFDCIGFRPSVPVYYVYAAPHRLGNGSITPEYASGASGDLDGNGIRGSYGYRSSNSNLNVGVIADGVSTCPANIEIETIFSCPPLDF